MELQQDEREKKERTKKTKNQINYTAFQLRIKCGGVEVKGLEADDDSVAHSDEVRVIISNAKHDSRLPNEE